MRFSPVALVFWCCSTALASGQQPQANIPVIGWLSPSTKQTVPVQLLRDQLAKHDLVDGTSIRLDIRLANGESDRLPALAKE